MAVQGAHNGAKTVFASVPDVKKYTTTDIELRTPPRQEPVDSTLEEKFKRLVTLWKKIETARKLRIFVYMDFPLYGVGGMSEATE